MKAIGYIKMVDHEKGFGFITTSAFEGENRRSIDVYFRLNRWQSGAVVPEFAMPVVFTRDRIDDRETAKNIKPLLCKESHIKLALQQAAQKGRIALYDPNIRKPVLKDVMQEIFERMDNGARDVVRDSVLSVISEVRDEERTGFVEAWSKNAFVRSSLMNIFSGSCEGCDQVALAVVRRALGIRLVNNIRRSLFPEQREFMSFLSLDKYDLCELIVELKGGEAEEMRRPDFSKIKRYKYGARGSALQRKEGMIPIQCKWGSLTGYAGDGYYTFEWQFTNRTPSDICEIEVVPGSDLVKITAKEIVSRLYKSNMNMEAGAAEKLSSLHDTLDKQLQEAGDDVFVYELLQNANDYPNGNEYVDAEFRVLRYKEGGGCLNFCHTGAVFSARNVAAICSANDQDKSDNLKAIGYKGIGFKTVFRFNDRAEVRSGEFGFAFDRKTQEIKDGVPWRTTPCWVYPKVRDGYRVDIRLVPHDPEKLGDGPQSYCHQLKELFEDEKPLLFIPHLRCVRLYLDDWDRPVIRTAKSEDWCTSTQYIENVTPTIRQMINDALKDTEHCRIPPKYGNLEKTAVSFACRRQGRRLLLEDNANLYCYLPAKDAQWGFKFLMNTDMIPNGPRNDIEYSLDVNRYFARIAGGKFFEWIDSLIRSGQYEYDSIFALIPDFEECIKNRNEKVVEFIKEFQGGFEGKLPQLQIPSSNKRLVPVSSIIHDTTGVLAEMGESVWGHLGIEMEIVDSSLRDRIPFVSFVKTYKEKLGIKEFGFDALLAKTSSIQFQQWLTNPMANKSFMEFLIGKGELVHFKEAKIFLDNNGDLGSPQEMYFHPDVEKYLKAFSWCFRYLPSSAPCREKLDKEWFMSLDPKGLVCDILFSKDNEARVREVLTNMGSARLFFGFLASHKKCVKTYNAPYYSKGNYGRLLGYRLISRQEYCFTKDFLEKLPVILDDGSTVSTIANGDYSIFLPTQQDSLSNPSEYKWIEQSWPRFLSVGYLDWEEGNKVRELLLEEHGTGNDKWQLVHNWNQLGFLVAIADKFKGRIRQKIADSRSDLGFYDFIFECIKGECINPKWIEEQLSGWPILDAHGQLVDSAGKTLFYYDDELNSWMQNGWLENSSFVILNQKYSEQKVLFDLLGVKVFAEGNFGELFKNCFSSKLLLDAPDKVIAFHHYMAGKRTLLSEDQASGLKNASVLLLGHEGVAKGLDGVYMAQRDDAVVTLVESGALSRDINVLDSRLCVSEEMLKYWDWLGCKMLDSDRLMDEKIRKYLLIQSSETNVEELKSIHKGFIREVIVAGGLETKLKGVFLYDEQGKLVNPDMLVLGTKFNPKCDFQGHGVSHQYVSEVYLDLIDDDDKVKSFLLGLGVREDFSKEDIACLSEISFCKYFWHDYVKMNEAVREKIHEWITPDSKCVLDRVGNVRAPNELYDVELVDYVNVLQNYGTKLPDVDVASGLGFKQQLCIVDCLDYLLTNPPAKMRGRVLVWLARGEIGANEQDAIDRYKASPNALWTNGRGDENSQIATLVAIRHLNSRNKASVFVTAERTLKTSGMGVEGSGMWDDVEETFSRLGVPLIDDESVEVSPISPKDVSNEVRKEISVRLFVFLMSREGDEGASIYDEKQKILAELKFVRCDSILVKYRDLLQNNQRKFMLDGDSVYFVGDWQSKYVYGDIVRKLSGKLFHGLYSDDDLKVAFDTDGGLTGLARKIVQDFCLHKNESFMSKLEKVSLQLKQDVEHHVQAETMFSSGNDEDKNGDFSEEEKGKERVQDSDAVKNDKEEPKEPEKHFTQEEEEQMLRVFGNDLTVEQMNDENRLVCIRLFNSLQAQGYEPKMVEVDFIKDVYVNQKTFRASTIETNDGRLIHVISARKGVAYLPPKWWARISTPSNTKYVICAVLNHHEDGFRYLKSRDDLIMAIGDNLVVIRVHGQTAEDRFDRTNELFSFNPDLSDFRTYALLRMKANCPIDIVFRENEDLIRSFGEELQETDVTENDDL